nr:LOW QUALITY PROTEIN: sentrin-specific protease 5-like [Labrus bergylta]
MVHSGSASPMKTTPSASPHLTVPATTPPLQVAALAPPPGDTTDQDLTQRLTTDLTSISDLTQTSTLTPADAEPPVTPVKSLAPICSPASVHTPTAAQGLFNGRTSGRKRTPKACDCCGPHGRGHNVGMPGRGKGRGRARGRGAGGNSWDTPKRKVGEQLTQIRSFDSTKERLEDAEDEDEGSRKVQKTPEAAESEAGMQFFPLPVTDSLQDGPIMNCSAPEEKEDVQVKEDFPVEGSGVIDAGGKGAGDSRDVDVRLSGTPSSGAPGGRERGGGSGFVGAASASKVEVDSGIKRGGVSGVSFSYKSFPIPQSMLTKKQEKTKDHGGQAEPTTVKSPFGNGDTVDLSDTEPEVEAKDNITISEMENGVLSISQQPDSPLDLDSEMQVDQTPVKTDSGSEPAALSNGDVTHADKDNHGSTLMEVETSSHPAWQGPITVDGTQHHWALRDHCLYCQSGTWEKEALKEVLRLQEGGKRQDEESREQLVDMVHEFLESFYIKYGGFSPLSETDVLEHLKKKKGDLINRELDIKGEMSRYRAALASAPVAGFMVSYNKHTLSLEDLGTLEDQNWLNDQIINMYGELIMEATQHKVHFFNSFFHKQLVAKGYDGVKRWTKKVDLFSKWMLLIPIHLEIHWSLITVTMATKTINYYDSQGIVFRHTTDNILRYLLSEAREKKQTAFQKGWKITIIKGIPQQKNDSDCGVFVLEYCRCLSVKQPLKFSQEDMPRIRKRIYKELCDCHLND